MNNLPDKKFDEAKIAGESLYSSLSEEFCPYFQEKIVFNSKGLEHLKFRRHGKARSRSDQYMRFKVLYLAPKVLGASRTLQGISKLQTFERIRMHSRVETKMVPTIFYEFIAIMDEARVKVIVKQINGGEKFFWSVVPYWKMDQRDNTRQFGSGDPDSE